MEDFFIVCNSINKKRDDKNLSSRFLLIEFQFLNSNTAPRNYTSSHTPTFVQQSSSDIEL